jgi:hypothetical protein
MSISTNPNRTVTIPWGSGARIPVENLADEAKIRSVIADASRTATSHLAVGDGYVRNWSADLDPAPGRILRTQGTGSEQRILAVETDMPENKPADQRPTSLHVQGGPNSTQISAQWVDGEFVKYEESSKKEGVVNRLSVVVNGNGTLTYSDTTTPA